MQYDLQLSSDLNRCFIAVSPRELWDCRGKCCMRYDQQLSSDLNRCFIAVLLGLSGMKERQCSLRRGDYLISQVRGESTTGLNGISNPQQSGIVDV